MNYVAYPIVDLQTKKVKEVLYFVDTELQKRRKELMELDRDSYLSFLEHDYAKRSLEDYSGEKGHFGIGALPVPEIDQEEAARIPDSGMSPKVIGDILEDKKTMEAIEKEIKQITDGQANAYSKVKNMKINI